MRKHFLILFLMALLPLAGWSANFNTEGKAVVDDIPYGQNVTIDNVHFTLNGVDQTPVGGATAIYALEDPFKYYTNADATTPLEGKPQCGTTYYIRIVPSDATNNGVTIAKVLFVKADLTVTVKSQAFFTKNFKEAKTALGSTLTAKKPSASGNADIVIAGIVDGEEIDDVLTWSNVDYSYDSENANCTSAEDWFKDAQNHDIMTNKITFTGFTLTEAGKKNYNLKFTDTYMKIKQIPLTLGNYATTLANGKFTVTRDASYSATNKPKYKGVAQNLKYTVKWQYAAGTGKVYEMTDDDIVIKYKGTSGNPVEDAIDADTYTPVVSFKANGNFSGNDIEITSSDALKYEIDRRELVVMLNANSKTYDGFAFLSTETGATQMTPKYNFAQLVGKDAGKEVTGITIEANDNTAGYLKKDVGKYALIPVITNAKIYTPAVYYTQEEATAYNAAHSQDLGFTPVTTSTEKTQASEEALDKNYNPVPYPANWEIKVKKITVTAEPTYATNRTSITYGENIPTITIKFKTGAEALTDDQDDVLACYKATTADKEDLISGDNVITVAQKSKEELLAEYYTNNHITTPSDQQVTEANNAVEDALAVLANYDPETIDGNLKVDGVGFTIAPNVSQTYEYGETITPDYVAVNTSVNPNVIVTTTKTPTFLYRKATEDASAATKDVPTAIGDYIVSIKEDATLAPTIGYDGKKIVYNETPFSITKKELDFTIGEVTLHNGDTKTTLNQYGKITLKTGYVLVGKEKLEVEYSFKSGVSGLTIGAETADYAISGAEGATYAAIVASLPEGKANNDNYTLKAGVTGNLKIAAGRLLFVDGTDANVNFLIKDAATAVKNAPSNDPITYNVTFADRTLKANEWNVLVLPFAITPLEFCNAKCTTGESPNTVDYINDYAVFNVLKSADQSKNSMKFGLTLNEIPANTPFLVKPSKEIKFMRTTGSGSNLKKYYLTFEKRKVEYKEVPAITVDGVNFIGTYKDLKNVEGGAKIMYMGADDAGHYTFYTATNNGEAFNIDLGSTRAYLDFTGTALGDAAAPTILVEEADGSTTAIVGITADGVAVAAEGWYTINGIKLQGVPTEKGVYINNGKKVVVK